jgi:hypothetical protein
MLNIKSVVFFVCLAAMLSSCTEKIDKKLLPGVWKGAEWIVAGVQDEIDASSASFSFQPDGQYTYTYNDAVEKGKYYVTNGELYTTPDGGTKMMVKITTLTQDSLVFNMNRGGQAETLTLVRAK